MIIVGMAVSSFFLRFFRWRRIKSCKIFQGVKSENCSVFWPVFYMQTILLVNKIKTMSLSKNSGGGCAPCLMKKALL